MGRRLERHLDEDLIDRIDAGWSPYNELQKEYRRATKPKHPPRPEWTYRAYWRNAWRYKREREVEGKRVENSYKNWLWRV